MTMEEAILSEYRRVGKVEGLELGKKVGVVNMLKKSYSINVICDLLEVTEETVTAIQQELKEKGEL